jgi:nitrogen fixation/metabolism regulation signal transduction histidine kinase
VISYLASKLLTFPLSLITQKLKQTTLSDNNAPLIWEQDDEIGLMVKEYNKMVSNLAESKKALARTEKETAWREIARQVAHEIKNPLTPMKLTLQHLQRTLDTKDKDSAIHKPINSLLYQIDTLSDIANSFSSFAQMPIPDHERYELSQLIRNTVNLHRNQDYGTFKVIVNDQEIYTIGDEQLMGRILSNLIINAFQSVAGHAPVIFVELKRINHNKLLIEVTDNGSGIPENIRDKIFMPNFTTKESGSGIGLAIAKHGIEHAGGKIWFETVLGKGTTFFIELPEVEWQSIE